MIKRERIGILSLYAAGGHVDRYKYVLIKSFIDYFGKFIIVINGQVNDEDLQNIKRYTDYIYLRPNKGYDIGAYKDTLINYLYTEKWQNWKELVLVNDTFYGPFFSWDYVFSVMEERENDFWGLGEHLGGKVEGMKPHIQSYFMAFREQILCSQYFWGFWKDFYYPRSREDAVFNFEFTFTALLKERGYIVDSYMKAFEPKFVLKYNRCAYLNDAYELLRDIKFPIVKFRLFTPVYYEEAQKVWNYIKDNCNYDLELISEHLERLEELGDIRPFGERQLERFYHTHNKIYIFGYGQYGKNLKRFFRKKGWDITSFVTTKGNSDEGILSLEQLNMANNDGIIIALGDNNSKEVYPDISKRFTDSQVLIGRLEMKDKVVR